MRRILLINLLFLVSLAHAGESVAVSPSSAGAQPPTLQILAVQEPPASYLDESGKPAGFAIDVLREIQRRVGNTDPVRIEPETRVYETGLRQPNVVLLSFSRVPEREASFHWIARIIRKPWNFYARADDQRSVSSLAEVRALTGVAVVAGDVRARWLQHEGLKNLLPAQSHEQAMRLLLARRVDAVFSEPQGVAWFCRVQGCGETPPRVLWTPRSSDVYILMSKRGTSAELAQRWRNAADAMATDGTLEALGRHWAAEAGRRFGMQAVWRNGALDFVGATAAD